jgi:hypothetical protein
MKNPYEILGISQNATKKEIITGKMIAMKKREFTLQEIQLAEIQLLNPSKRLVADFMYPAKIKAKRPKLIHVKTPPLSTKIEDIDIDALDSLKNKLYENEY